SRRWDGLGHHILMEQTHPPLKESWKRHYDYLIKAWTDPRAIKVDGKPVFVIYRPQHIENIDEMLDYWRELARQDGLPGLYFIFQKQYELATHDYVRSFDALFQFQPFEAVNSPTYEQSFIRRLLMFNVVRKLPERYQVLVREIKAKFNSKLTFHDYDTTWKKIAEVRPDPKLTTYPGAFVDWDNAARYKERATIFTGASPEKFESWLANLLDTMPSRKLPEDFIFLNAWNEWSEAAYLEPDERHGYKYLEAVRKLVGRRS
ncbi:MAG: glycoside hydrolase family 99-like domain-containing protein, partial [Gallionella sp.]